MSLGMNSSVLMQGCLTASALNTPVVSTGLTYVPELLRKHMDMLRRGIKSVIHLIPLECIKFGKDFIELKKGYTISIGNLQHFLDKHRLLSAILPPQFFIGLGGGFEGIVGE